LEVISHEETIDLGNLGGSWGSNHVDIHEIAVPAGTYMVSLTGDFYRRAATSATPVLQIQLNGADGGKQITAYTGAFPYHANQDASNALGLADNGRPKGLEQTASATGIITVSSATTLSLDAFGYNPDRSSAGSNALGVIANVELVRINVD